MNAEPQANQPRIRVGCAGWSVPKEFETDTLPPSETLSHLMRYGRRLDAVEINTSFKSDHRRGTYERWAASVPEDFRFAVKIPRRVSHDRALRDSEDDLKAFLDAVSGLGKKRGPLLLQLPPSGTFDSRAAGHFFALYREIDRGQMVIEPRHPSWFRPDAVALCREYAIGWVDADPKPFEGVDVPDVSRYLRLHGAPRMYYSSYSERQIELLSERLSVLGVSGETWCIFDNTAEGHALPNALALAAHIEALREITAVAGSSQDVETG